MLLNLLIIIGLLYGCDEKAPTEIKPLQLKSLSINKTDYFSATKPFIAQNHPIIEIVFNTSLLKSTVNSYSFELKNSNNVNLPINIQLVNSGDSILIIPKDTLSHFDKYVLHINGSLKGSKTESFTASSYTFYTRLDTIDKFEKVSNAELLDKVQYQTFRYFWAKGHPVSGLAPERNATPNTVTIGGSGFGVMAMIVAMERGFISRSAGMNRLDTITDFLLNTAERFHGVWPHWLNGTTGKTIPFSAKDNGADLVETSYMIHALYSLKQYLNRSENKEDVIYLRIQQMINEVEWDWFRKNGEEVLYWHWSPNFEWAMNHQIRGYNECLITYILATASETHGIPSSVYDQGWAQNGKIVNDKTFYGIRLPLGFDYGGPLFFAQYSFLGLDPRNLEDKYGNYWDQNVNHSLINFEHCKKNPQNYFGYGEHCWGLTASDDYKGYGVHDPTQDNGTISPTAAISSLPYTPNESMKAIEFFYYKLGDKIWGENGFYDSFNPNQGAITKTYLAIDQGPEIVMIENYRSGLMWNLFMKNPEIQAALTKLGFRY